MTDQYRLEPAPLRAFLCAPLSNRFLARLPLCAVVLCLALLSACSRSTLPRNEEIDASIATTRWLDAKFGVVNNRDVGQLLNRVTDRLQGAVYGAALETELDRGVARDYSNFRWQVFVLKAREPNAFSAGGGVIFVTSGMFVYGSSEAELAAVISHEMAHQLLGHIKDALDEDGFSPDGPHYTTSLDNELEADRLGVRILRAAHYDPRAAVSALTIPYRLSGRNVSEGNKAWIDARTARLHQQIGEMGNFLPATESSREYNRVRMEFRQG